MSKPLLTQIVEIDWVDSCSTHEWRSIADHMLDESRFLYKSIGYLVKKTDKLISIAQNKSYATGNISDVMHIPMVAVVKIRKIKS